MPNDTFDLNCIVYKIDNVDLVLQGTKVKLEMIFYLHYFTKNNIANFT